MRLVYALVALGCLVRPAWGQRPPPQPRVAIGTSLTLGESLEVESYEYSPLRPGASVSLALQPFPYAPLFVEVGAVQNRRGFPNRDRETGEYVTGVSSATFGSVAIGADVGVGLVQLRAGPRLKVPIASRSYADFETIALGVLGEASIIVATVSRHPISMSARYHQDLSSAFESRGIRNSFPTVEARIEVGL